MTQNVSSEQTTESGVDGKKSVVELDAVTSGNSTDSVTCILQKILSEIISIHPG